jgi:hypothetical protein
MERPMTDSILQALSMAFAIGWEILWPRILGFLLTAVVEAVVSHQQMSRLLPDDRPRSIVRALALGAASSSGSYAAVELVRSLFRKGADFTAAMAFEMASTNPILELSVIMLVFPGLAVYGCRTRRCAARGNISGAAVPALSPPRTARRSQAAGNRLRAGPPRTKRVSCDVLWSDWYATYPFSFGSASSRHAIQCADQLVQVDSMLVAVTELKAMAAAAIKGDSKRPLKGWSTPIATGMPSEL